MCRRWFELHSLRLELVERNLYLVLINVERYAHLGVSRLDLIQEGSASLFRAVADFDWRRGLLFRTYGLVATEDENGRISVLSIGDINDREAVEPLLTQAHSFSRADGGALFEALGPLLTNRGSITLDEASLTLIVSDIQRVQDAIAAMLAQLDRPPEPDTVR